MNLFSQEIAAIYSPFPFFFLSSKIYYLLPLKESCGASEGRTLTSLVAYNEVITKVHIVCLLVLHSNYNAFIAFLISSFFYALQLNSLLPLAFHMSHSGPASFASDRNAVSSTAKKAFIHLALVNCRSSCLFFFLYWNLTDPGYSRNELSSTLS